MYFCGPTVYQRIHVGNAVPFVLPLWLRRWLEHAGLRDEGRRQHHGRQRQDLRRRARRERAARRGRDSLVPRGHRPARPRPARCRADCGRDRPRADPDDRGAGRQRDTRTSPTATSTTASPSFPEYGRLSGQRPDQVEEQEPNPRKEDPRDFALWKATKPGEDTSWESPWGRGRPGWHIECSVMAEKHLGPEFEIHGGGLDLVFPHHENELAQSRALGHGFAHIWMHNGLLRFGGEKMSKSVGNVVSLKDALDRWGRETLLLFFLTGHWRKPLEYTDETMAAATARVEWFRELCSGGTSVPAPDDAWDRVSAALEDDFNTPAALAVMHDWRSRGHICCRRASTSSGSDPCESGSRLPRRSVQLAERRAEARAQEGLGRGGPTSWRDRGRRGGMCVTSPSGPFFRLVPRVVNRELVYGRNAVREALRGAVRCSSCGRASERPRRCPGCPRGRASQVRKERELTEAAGSPDHQGVVAWAAPYPVRRRVGAGRGRPAAAGVPRPGDRSSQPRSGRAQRRRRGCDGPRPTRARCGPCHRRRLPRVRRRGRASPDRRRAESLPLPGRGQA